MEAEDSAKDSAEDAVVSQSTTAACDGGGGPLGHPTVYLKIGAAGNVVCPYCSRTFVLSGDADAAAGH